MTLAVIFMTASVLVSANQRSHGTADLGPAYWSYTGNEYRALPAQQKHAYVVGVVDGMLISPLIMNRQDPWLGQCVAGMQSDQVEAIFEKYLEANPQVWHEPANFLVFKAFWQKCLGAPHKKTVPPN
jgi:hypothetical protein